MELGRWGELEAFQSHQKIQAAILMGVTYVSETVCVFVENTRNITITTTTCHDNGIDGNGLEIPQPQHPNLSEFDEHGNLDRCKDHLSTKPTLATSKTHRDLHSLCVVCSVKR